MQIFHIATVADWTAAQQTGAYTTSTRGRTLAEEGFIHASRGDQWLAVRRRFYGDIDEPIVLLTIDTDLLTSRVVEEPVADSEETFPHVYGPIDVAAVLTALPLDGPGDAEPVRPANPVHAEEPSPSFSTLFLAEMFHNVLLATIVLATMSVGAVIGTLFDAIWAPITGIAIGLVVGLLVAVGVHRRHRR